MPEPLRRWLLPASMAVLAAVIVAGLLVDAAPPGDRGEALASRLRCPVCQSESVADSPSETARNMRERIDELIAAGASDAEVEQFFVDRYGEWILLDPRPGPRTWALWALPAIVLFAGGFAAWRLRSPHAAVEPTPEQQAVVARLLRGRRDRPAADGSRAPDPRARCPPLGWKRRARQDTQHGSGGDGVAEDVATAQEVETYDPTALEPALAQRWHDERTYSVANDAPGEPYYALHMFPYPSGDIHMGHVEAFSLADAVARYARMRGYAVLNPFGWDSFGLNAENAAKRRGVDPREWTYENIAQQRSTIVRIGFSFDWERVLHTSDPEYYRWTQWIFLQLYNAGHAYRAESPVNWCPKDQTVLANEQVKDGRCDYCDTEVVRKPLTQWFLRITEYAEQLLDDLDTLAGKWPDRIVAMQRNWIGRSEGAEVVFAVDGSGEEVTVFTTRPDTLYGATYFVFAPEHPLVREKMAGDADYEAFVAEVSRRTEIERLSTEGAISKRGHRLDFDMVNPVNGERIPAYAADYVLMEYGTGAIMAVP
ncbi:MAG: class I tRNA ligase family protein, partial [Nitriliruptorales bacterium]